MDKEQDADFQLTDAKNDSNSLVDSSTDNQSQQVISSDQLILPESTAQVDSTDDMETEDCVDYPIDKGINPVSSDEPDQIGNSDIDIDNSDLNAVIETALECKSADDNLEVESELEAPMSTNDLDVQQSDEVSDLGEYQSEVDNQTKSESAFQRLASLGVIAADEPVEESKESILKKLASRGSISIIPPSAGTVLPSSSSATPTPYVKETPSPKSIKQKSKKIKIDPGSSLDIDKDFDSLISALSSGEAVKQPNESETMEPIEESNVLKINSDTSNAELSSEQASGELNGSNPVEETVDNDQNMPDMDSVSQDGSKSSDENDERIPIPPIQQRNIIEEGSAEILLTARNVFYNKVQEFNRDMSIAALTVFSEMHQQDPRTRNRGKKRKACNETDTSSISVVDDVFEPGKISENGITILEALSATGLRSIRYAREIPGVKQIYANDLSEEAVASIKKNIEHNGVENLVTTTKDDASFLMYKRLAEQQSYDAIDLDPYGCPSRFLDSAVQVVRDGGLLLVTCTDMAVLAGNSPETCHTKYGAISLRSQACHEMAIRIVLQCIESYANRYGRYTVPLLSFSVDFYIRVIVQVYTSPVTCKKSLSKLSMVYQCTGCHTLTFQPLGAVSQTNINSPPKFVLPHSPGINEHCFHCHYKHHMGGPIWNGPIYSTKFVESMLSVAENGMFGTFKRMQGMLEVIREELPDVPLYYTINGLCSRLHCQAIPLIDIRSAILNAGYRVSSSHAAPTAIKTNAPAKVIWDIMRCWVHMNPVSQKRMVPGSVIASIILEPPSLIANFDIHPKARPSSSMRKLVRYQPNPEKNWGPGTRARYNNPDDETEDKRKQNQNKHKNKAQAPKTVQIIEVVTIDDEDETKDEEETSPTAESSSGTA